MMALEGVRMQQELAQRLLIIDDDQELTELLKEYLEQHHFILSCAHLPSEGFEKLNQENPSLIILDVMLPEQNGFEVCAEIRKKSRVPIIMLSAQGRVSDRVQGLQLGADDYLPKPFEPEELLARIQSVLRRFTTGVKPTILRFGDLEINLLSRSVTLASASLPLTTAEFELLVVFANNPGETLNRDQIAEQLRGTEWAVTSRSFDLILSRIRKKLGDDPKNPRFFRTIWGSGYAFIAPPH